MYESRLKAESFYIEEVSGEELADHYRYMFSLPDFKEIVTKQLQGRDFPLPLSQIHNVFNFKHGNIIFLSANRYLEHGIYLNGSRLFLNKPIPVFLIFKIRSTSKRSKNRSRIGKSSFQNYGYAAQ
jgi:hypothetical protein